MGGGISANATPPASPHRCIDNLLFNMMNTVSAAGIQPATLALLQSHSSTVSAAEWRSFCHAYELGPSQYENFDEIKKSIFALAGQAEAG